MRRLVPVGGCADRADRPTAELYGATARPWKPIDSSKGYSFALRRWRSNFGPLPRVSCAGRVEAWDTERHPMQQVLRRWQKFGDRSQGSKVGIRCLHLHARLWLLGKIYGHRSCSAGEFCDLRVAPRSLRAPTENHCGSLSRRLLKTD